MKKIALTLVFLLLSASAVFAADVYLADGSVIKALNVSRSGDKVVVLINRESTATFNASEIDMEKTRISKAKKSKPKKARVKAEEPEAMTAGDEKPAAVSKGVAVSSAPASSAPPAKAATTAPATAVTTAPVATGAATPQQPKPSPPAVQPEPPKPPAPVKLTPPPAMPPTPLPSPPSDMGALAIVPLIVGLLVLLVVFVAFWKIFEKAGEPGWKCLIPVYNAYMLVIISGKPGWWFILFFVPIVGIIINLLVCLGLANRFGKGNLYGIGLFLLGPIFYLHLAFSDAEYQG